MEWQDAQHLAASAMSAILTAHHVNHAFIGGFAVQSLGSTRRTEDIDIEIDINGSGSSSREQIVQRIIEADPRFCSPQGRRLYFTPPEAPEHRVPIDMLPAGQLGLPRTLDIIYAGDDDSRIPILRPSVLVLTKIRRCVHYIDSTRPKSKRVFEADLTDIHFLLVNLVEKGEKIDFRSYSSPNPERLYTAVGDLLDYEYLREGLGRMVETILAVLEDSDFELINAIFVDED